MKIYKDIVIYSLCVHLFLYVPDITKHNCSRYRLHEVHTHYSQTRKTCFTTLRSRLLAEKQNYSNYRRNMEHPERACINPTCILILSAKTRPPTLPKELVHRRLALRLSSSIIWFRLETYLDTVMAVAA